MTLELTTQDMVDVRRHCGFGFLGADSNKSLMFFRYWPSYMTLEYRLGHLLDEEIILLQAQYLPNLNQLEIDIYGVRDNVDTKSAAVWHWNEHEASDRIDLYNYHRKMLCSFFQVEPGPFFVSSSGVMRFVV